MKKVKKVVKQYQNGLNIFGSNSIKLTKIFSVEMDIAPFATKIIAKKNINNEVLKMNYCNDRIAILAVSREK